MKNTVIIIGGGLMQIPAIAAAKLKGLFVVVVDGNPDCVGKAYANDFWNIDIADKESVYLKTLDVNYHDNIGGVFTAATDFSTTAAYVAEKMSLPGISYETALNCTDKGRMRCIFKESGIPSPKFKIVNPKYSIFYNNYIGYPVVVKPVDNMGARGVVQSMNENELQSDVQNAFKHSRIGEVIIEEYIQGNEYSIDALVYNGEITICGIADRHITKPPYFVEMGHTIPSTAPANVQAEIIAVFKQAVKALGIDNGAAKGDMFYTDKGPVVGEIAARLSGGYMSGWTYPYSSGVDLTAAALNISLGLPPGDLTPTEHTYVAEKAIVVDRPGKIQAFRGILDAQKNPDVLQLFLRSKVGDEVKPPTNNVEKCGNVLTAGDTAEDAEAKAEAVVKSIEIILE